MAGFVNQGKRDAQVHIAAPQGDDHLRGHRRDPHADDVSALAGDAGRGGGTVDCGGEGGGALTTVANVANGLTNLGAAVAVAADEGGHRIHHRALLVERQLGVDRDGDGLGRRALRVREVARRVIAERSVYRRAASGMFAMVITPPVSKVLAQGGFKPASLAQYWFDHATITCAEYNFRSRYGQSATPAPTIQSLLDKGALDPALFGNKGPDDTVPMFQTPDTIHVFVSGDRGRNKYTSLWGPYFTPTLKAIALPAEWEEKLAAI